jgi:hypothetical protein
MDWRQYSGLAPSYILHQASPVIQEALTMDYSSAPQSWEFDRSITGAWTNGQNNEGKASPNTFCTQLE